MTTTITTYPGRSPFDQSTNITKQLDSAKLAEQFSETKTTSDSENSSSGNSSPVEGPSLKRKRVTANELPEKKRRLQDIRICYYPELAFIKLSKTTLSKSIWATKRLVIEAYKAFNIRINFLSNLILLLSAGQVNPIKFKGIIETIAQLDSHLLIDYKTLCKKKLGKLKSLEQITFFLTDLVNALQQKEPLKADEQKMAMEEHLKWMRNQYLYQTSKI